MYSDKNIIIKLKLVIFLFVVLSVNKCFAQQEPQYTLFWNNYSIFNPASSGLYYKNYFSINGRSEWTKFEEHPQTISVVYDYNFEKINSGIGLNYYFDKLSFEKNNKINLNYSYYFQFKNNQKLSFGLAISYLNKTIDFGQANFPDQLNYDTLIVGNLLDFNLGTIYKTENLLIGLSITQLKASELKKLNFKNERYYFVTCSYNVMIGSKFEMRPTINLKIYKSGICCDFNLLNFYKKIYWFGLSYRTTNTRAVMIGIDIKRKFRIGYNFEYTPLKSNFIINSHEVVFAIMLK